MPTRAALLALPRAALLPMADAALRASSERWGLLPVRAVGLSHAQLVQVVVTAQLRAVLTLHE